jgi:oligoribonuclease
MTDIKQIIPTKLLWVDLEMTGLDPQKDVLLEVAAEVTDFDFKTLASYESRIKQPKQVVESRMQANIWWKDYPENRDDFLKNLEGAPDLKTVEQDLIELVNKHFGTEPAILAGNSIHNDRTFIKKWWPGLDLRLHYRMLDVTSFKILMQGKFGQEYTKKDAHRAFDDIQASIAELQFYLEQLKKV